MDYKKDLRVKITKKLVFDAILKLLLRRKFEQITVYEICESAQISRATFYVHFEDKYDLLKIWLTSHITDIYNNTRKAAIEKKAEYINEFIYNNKKMIENILTEASNETLEIVFEVICGFLDISADEGDKMNPEYVVLSNIYAGGIISYLKWQVKNRFPKEVEVSNEYLMDIIKDYL